MMSVLDKAGALGVFTAAIGCASCFPALGSLGAALGMGFLAHYEAAFINTLLPVFAGIVLAANVFSYFSHKIWYRTLAGISGPTLVLLTMYPLWTYDWSTYLLYAGIVLMLMVSIGDVFFPAGKICSSCTVPDRENKNAWL